MSHETSMDNNIIFQLEQSSIATLTELTTDFDLPISNNGEEQSIFDKMVDEILDGYEDCNDMTSMDQWHTLDQFPKKNFQDTEGMKDPIALMYIAPTTKTMRDPPSTTIQHSVPQNSVLDRELAKDLIAPIYAAPTTKTMLDPPSISIQHNESALLESKKKPQQQHPAKPKKCLSSYNWFFKFERKRILEQLPGPEKSKPKKSHGKIGFAALARTIAAKWRKLSDSERAPYENLAQMDKLRYNLEKAVRWKKEKIAEAAASSAPAKLTYNNTARNFK